MHNTTIYFADKHMPYHSTTTEQCILYDLEWHEKPIFKY